GPGSAPSLLRTRRASIEKGGPEGPPFSFASADSIVAATIGERIMALKVELKPGEKLLVGNCVITNSDQRTRLFIEGKAPILREKDILTPATADTPAKAVYLAVQIMYVEGNVAKLSKNYFSL